MPSSIHRGREDNWVDIFSGQTFEGHRVRICAGSASPVSPKAPSLSKIGSLIVGPGAFVIVTDSKGSTGSLRVLHPGSVIPDLRAAKSESNRLVGKIV